MTVAEHEKYIQSIDDMEQRVINDNVYPKLRSNRCKAFCFVSEPTKECIRNFEISSYNNATKSIKPKSKTRMSKKPHT